jgi:DNA transposition AAA+ family ATPase
MMTEQDDIAKGWPEPKREPERASPQALDAWRTAVRRTREIALREGWTRAEVARRSDIAASTLTQIMDGTYPADIAVQAGKLTKWLDAYDATRALAAQMPEVPGWVSTPTGEEIISTLTYCQMLPDWGLVTLGAGMGKTITARHYCATRPSAWRVTMRPRTGSVSTMLHEIAQAIGVTERNPIKLDRAIGERLKRNGRHTLLIVDEAQNLVDAAVDQLRFFLDEYECGLCLMGNDELYTRSGLGKPREGYAQIHRRIGPRLKLMRPRDADIAAVIAAWKVEDPAIVRMLQAIGRKPGALGQITKTMQGAAVRAAGSGRPIELAHVRAAWTNRDSGEEVHL